MHDARPVRRLFAALVLITTVIAAIRLWAIFRVDGLTVLEIALLAIFAVLFAWIGSSFWLVCVGAHARWRGLIKAMPPAAADGSSSTTRTAIVMPIYNEPSARLFAGVRAMYESLSQTGAIGRFDFYVLSDSNNPDCFAAEEAEWMRLRRLLGGRIFYRRRSLNSGRKSGNIAEFCRNWGSLYDYLVILDADSLMSGETMVELVRRMDANPRAALIQTLPVLIGRGSVFTAIQQFVSRVYGPLFGAGLAVLLGPDGNYWGHNAIIRRRAFVESCGLPTLPGKAPLGGEILSHDFVEAALLRRAGWDLWLAPDLGGSFEEAPGIVDYIARDRRWCQGNLQHIRLIFARGLRAQSRMHLALGAMSYLSAPLWLLFLVLSAIETHARGGVAPFFYKGGNPILNLPVEHRLDVVTLVVMTLVLLFGPKLVAFAMLLRDPSTVRAMGGAGRAALGIVLESVFSALFAPIAMLSHSGFVISILSGRSTSWKPPRRGQHRTARGAAAQGFIPHVILALGAGVAAYVWIPAAFWWLTPLLIGPALSIILVELASDPKLGRGARRAGLFITPDDDAGIVRRVETILSRREADRLALDGQLDRRNAAPGLRGARRGVEAGSSSV